jgi:hypothetical protein
MEAAYMRRLCSITTLLAMVIVAGCAKETVQRIPYKLDTPEIKAIAVLPTQDQLARVEVKSTPKSFWVVRTSYKNWGTPLMEYARFSPTGIEEIPFTAAPKVEFQGLFGSTVIWHPVGDQLYAKHSESDGAHLHLKHSYLRLHPQPVTKVPLDQSLYIKAASETEVYAVGGEQPGNLDTVFVFDHALQPKDRFKVKGATAMDLTYIGGGRLLIGGAPFDLAKKDFTWEPDGSSKQTFAKPLSWSGMTVGPDGTLWFAKFGDDQKLHVEARDPHGKELAVQVVAPHQLRTNSSMALLATRSKLVIAAMGRYQGEDQLLLFTFRAR